MVKEVLNEAYMYVLVVLVVPAQDVKFTEKHSREAQ